jgi:hypothetical protein
MVHDTQPKLGVGRPDRDKKSFAWGDQAKMRSSCNMTDRTACLLQTGLVGGYEISEELD